MSAKPASERHIRLSEASKRCGIPTSTLRRWCALDKIPSYKVVDGGFWYIDIKALMRSLPTLCPDLVDVDSSLNPLKILNPVIKGADHR